MMRETIESAEYENFFVVQHKYDFTLKALSRHFNDKFIESVLEDPYYLEIKLIMILYFISKFNRQSAQNLLDAFKELLTRIKTKKINIWTANI